MAAATLFVACAIDPADDISRTRWAAGPELPPDAFTDAIMPTDGATGWTAGQGSVTEDGAAVFDVPLVVPAGRNGIQPELSLHYHSRNGDGMLGTGWSLSGLSMITRCARNEPIDGVNRDVQFTPDDAFCLDGDRLVEPPAGGFWGGGEYRRWRNGFERITRDGQPGDPASVFQVWRPDGTIWTYGGASDGYIDGPRVAVDPADGGPLPPTSATYGWLLTRMEDRHGNYAEYPYERVVEPDGTVTVVPTSIVYTGHPTLGPGQRSVHFEYQPRLPDTAAVVQWISGFGLRTSRLLSAIVMSAPGDPSIVRAYTLEYAGGQGRNPATHLAEVAECSAGACRSPLEFEYAESGYGPDDEPVIPRAHHSFVEASYGLLKVTGLGASIVPSDSPELTQFDLQSTALVAYNSGSTLWSMFRESREGATHGATWDALTAGPFLKELTQLDGPHFSPDLIPFNYDRDLVPDFLYPEPHSEDLALFSLVRNESSTDPLRWLAPYTHTYTTCSGGGREVLLGDLDGDGVEDLIQYCGGDSPVWQYRLHAGPWGSYGPVTTIPYTGDPSTVRIIDFDGDGRHELLVPRATGWYYDSMQLDSTGTFATTRTNIPVQYPAVFLDANGDGLVDVATLEPAGTSSDANVPVLRLNIGGTLSDPVPALPSSDPDYWIWQRPDLFGGVEPRDARDIRVADLNADGRDDFIAMFDLRFEPLTTDPFSAPRYQCSPSAPSTCVEESDNGLMLAHISAGDHFYTVRFGRAGQRLNYPTRRGWTNTELIDLGADGLPDFVYAHRAWTEASYQVDYLTVRPNNFRIVPGLLVRAGHPSDPGHDAPQSVAEFKYQHVSMPDGACDFPVRCAAEGVHVVGEFRDALGRLHTHWYRGPRVDLRSGQSLGFSRHYAVDESTQAVSESRFDNSTDTAGVGIAYAGLANERITYAPVTNAQGPGFLVRHELLDYGVTHLSAAHHAVQLQSSHVRTYELSTIEGGCVPVESQLGCDANCRTCSPIILPGTPSPLTEQLASVQYDTRGSVKALTQSTPGLQTDTVTYTLEHRASDWLIGLRRRVDVHSTGYSGGTVTGSAARVSTHEYDANGFPVRSIVEPDDPAAMLEIVRRPDGLGSMESVTESAAGLEPRTTTFYRDPEEAIHPMAVVNPEGHLTMVAIHPGLGVPVLTVDPNGVETRSRYDEFGRLRSSYRQGSEAATTAVSYQTCVTSAACITVDTETPGHSHVQHDIDPLGRVQISRELLPDGWVQTDLLYDSTGRLHEVIGPRRASDTEYFHRTMDHDALGRPTRVQYHDGRPDATFEYSGLTSTQTDRRGRETLLVFDARGRVRQRTVYDSGVPVTVAQTYGAFDVIQRVQTAGISWHWEHDPYGRVKSSSDPDSGARSYEYNGFGELTREYAGGTLWNQVVDRDRLGRVRERWNADDGSTIFKWDDASHGLGYLAEMYNSSGVVTRFAYDEFARQSSVQQSIGGEPALESYVKFDEYGRLWELYYPHTGNARHFAARYQYDEVQNTGRVASVDAFLVGSGPTRLGRRLTTIRWDECRTMSLGAV